MIFNFELFLQPYFNRLVSLQIVARKIGTPPSGDDFDSDGEYEYVPNESDSSSDDMILPSQPDVYIAESSEEDDLV